MRPSPIVLPLNRKLLQSKSYNKGLVNYTKKILKFRKDCYLIVNGFSISNGYQFN